MTSEGLYKSRGDDLPTRARCMLEVVGKHPLHHQSGENLQVLGAVGSCRLLPFRICSWGGSEIWKYLFFFPVFLSLNLVHHIEYQASKRREKMGF